jgi:hypothetical protein
MKLITDDKNVKHITNLYASGSDYLSNQTNSYEHVTGSANKWKRIVEN